MDTPELPDLAQYSPETRDAIARLYKMRESMHLQAFYCTRGRECDGDPHDGFPWQHARADQWPPPGTDWFAWILMGGRGSGKTRTGSEYTRQASKKIGQLTMIGQTATAVRDVMIEDPDSGIIRVFERYGERVEYEPTKRRINLPNGAVIRLFSAEEPARLRGPQHGFIWFDEPAHYPKAQDVWDMALLGLRKGTRTHVVLTTTPLPTKWMRARLAEPTTRVHRVSTYANLRNLAPDTAERILARYEGTRLGRQELHGEVLEDVEGALWSLLMLQYEQVDPRLLTRIVVGVDPAGSTRTRADETGIVVAGILGDQIYVLEDASGKYTPEAWAREVQAKVDKWEADAVCVERNFGGDMVRSTLRTIEASARVKDVHASRGKQVRAEPVVSRYEQGKVYHLPGLAELEEEMTTWVPGLGASPNRVDALVWACTELIGNASGIATPVRPRGMLRETNSRLPGTKRSALQAMGLRKR